MFFAAAVLSACTAAPRLGDTAPRRGDEIVIAGRYVHTGAPVVLWTDPGGYDAYRTEKRFVAFDERAWDPASKSTPNRFGMRFERAASETFTPGQIEQIRGGGWDLALLRDHVDQFVLHYDVCGTSRTCFRVLHDQVNLSVHFMLDIDGTIYQTLDVKERAWHATRANDRSVGIEIANMGAYPPADVAAGKTPLTQWYARDQHGTRITIPERLGDGGVRTAGFVGRPARDELVTGVIHDTDYAQFDLTPQQYASLIKLTAALHLALPKIALDYPRDADGKLLTRDLTADEFAAFHGVLGHFHVQKEKNDPGPALDWDRVINGARELARRRPRTP